MKFIQQTIFPITFLCSILFSNISSMDFSNSRGLKRKLTEQLVVESRENLFEKNKEYFETTGNIEDIDKNILEKLKEKYLAESLKDEKYIEITKLLLNTGTDPNNCIICLKVSSGSKTLRAYFLDQCNKGICSDCINGFELSIRSKNLKAFFLLCEFGAFIGHSIIAKINCYGKNTDFLDRYQDNQKEEIIQVIENKWRHEFKTFEKERKKIVQNFLIPELSEIVVGYEMDFDSGDFVKQIRNDYAFIVRNKLKIQRIDNKDLFRILFEWISKKDQKDENA